MQAPLGKGKDSFFATDLRPRDGTYLPPPTNCNLGPSSEPLNTLQGERWGRGEEEISHGWFKEQEKGGGFGPLFSYVDRARTSRGTRTVTGIIAP